MLMVGPLLTPHIRHASSQPLKFVGGGRPAWVSDCCDKEPFGDGSIVKYSSGFLFPVIAEHFMSEFLKALLKALCSGWLLYGTQLNVVDDIMTYSSGINKIKIFGDSAVSVPLEEMLVPYDAHVYWKYRLTEPTLTHCWILPKVYSFPLQAAFLMQ